MLKLVDNINNFFLAANSVCISLGMYCVDHISAVVYNSIASHYLTSEYLIPLAAIESFRIIIISLFFNFRLPGQRTDELIQWYSVFHPFIHNLQELEQNYNQYLISVIIYTVFKVKVTFVFFQVLLQLN